MTKITAEDLKRAKLELQEGLAISARSELHARARLEGRIKDLAEQVSDLRQMVKALAEKLGVVLVEEPPRPRRYVAKPEPWRALQEALKRGGLGTIGSPDLGQVKDPEEREKEKKK